MFTRVVKRSSADNARSRKSIVLIRLRTAESRSRSIPGDARNTAPLLLDCRPDNQGNSFSAFRRRLPRYPDDFLLFPSCCNGFPSHVHRSSSPPARTTTGILSRRAHPALTQDLPNPSASPCSTPLATLSLDVGSCALLSSLFRIGGGIYLRGPNALKSSPSSASAFALSSTGKPRSKTVDEAVFFPTSSDLLPKEIPLRPPFF